LIDRVSLYGVGPNKKPRERTSHRIHFSMLVGWQGRKMIAVYYWTLRREAIPLQAWANSAPV